ncbi:hypothetical protein N7486_011100 [Penicillium sp. IBT 16267x]|nr:hypothetical protein N7486_011100 [Penicillium sp. IBT 16267x]
MTLTRNQKRAQARQQCREALAAHIHERLGFTVPPQRVRLKPSVEDGYMQDKEYLLDTNLGNGTVGRYQDIQQQLGSSFEAVTPQRQQSIGAVTTSNIESLLLLAGQGNGTANLYEQPKNQQPGSASFTETIRRLEQEKQDLAVELERARARSEELLSKDREWQAKACCLQQELEECKSSVDQLSLELVWAKDRIHCSHERLAGFPVVERGQN